MSAPPARPECSAIQPAWRPITSTTITRSWRLGGGVQPVDRVGRDLHRGVEPERHLGRREVVVDRLRHADDADAVAAELRGDAERVLAADRDQRVDPLALAACRAPVRRRRRPCTGSCASTRGSCRPGAGCPRVAAIGEVDGLALDHAAPPVAEADDVVAVHALALAHDRPGSPRSDPGSRRRRSAPRSACGPPTSVGLPAAVPLAATRRPDSVSMMTRKDTLAHLQPGDGAPPPARRAAPRRRARCGSPSSARRCRCSSPGGPIYLLAVTSDRLLVFGHARARSARAEDRPRCCRAGTTRSSSMRVRRGSPMLQLRIAPAPERGRDPRVPAPRPAASAADRSCAVLAPAGADAATDAAPPPPRRPVRLRRDRAVVLSIDAGTTGIRTFAIDERRRRRGHGRTASSRSTSRSPGGSSTTPTRSGTRRSRRSPRSRARLAAAGETVVAHRHHEPARDHRRLEPAHRPAAAPGDRLAGPAHRGATATSSAPPASEPLVRRAHRARARSVLLGDQARVAADARAASRPSPDLAFGTVDSWLLYRLTGGARARDRPVEREPHAALRHRRARAGPTSSASCSACPTSCLARGAARAAGASASPIPTRAAGLARAGERHRRRPAGRAVRPGVLRAGHGEEHLRHRLVRAREPRARRSPSRSRGCSRRVAWQARLDARPSTRWRARSSSPAPRSSGCATGSASSTTPPRPDRSPRASPTPAASMFVPAFTGLGSPYWDPYARGTILGLTRGTGRAAARARGRRVDGVPDRATSSTR